jgi:hypothetical protein
VLQIISIRVWSFVCLLCPRSRCHIVW